MERTAGDSKEIDILANHFFITRDEALLEQIVTKCQPFIEIAVYKLFAAFSTEDREEVIQNALMDVVRLLRSTKKSGERNWEPLKKFDFMFTPLFFRQVCFNRLRNEYRRLTSRTAKFHMEAEDLDSLHGGPQAESPPLDAEVIREEIICQFLQYLDERDREIFIGRLNDRSFHDIGEVLGAPEKFVRARLHRIKKRLAKTPVYRALKLPDTGTNASGEGWIMSRNIDYVKVRRPDHVEQTVGSKLKEGQLCLSVTNIAVEIVKHRDNGRFDIKNILNGSPVENLHPEYGMVPIPVATAQLLKVYYDRDRADEEKGKLRQPSFYCEAVSIIYSDSEHFIDSDEGALKLLAEINGKDLKGDSALKAIDEAPAKETEAERAKTVHEKTAAEAEKVEALPPKEKKPEAPPKKKKTPKPPAEKPPTSKPKASGGAKVSTTIVKRHAAAEFSTRADLIRACINTESMTKSDIVKTATECYEGVAKNALYTQLSTVFRSLKKKGFAIVESEDGHISARKA